MMTTTVKIQLRLPVELRDWLESHSAKHDRSMNGQVVAILKNLARQEQSEQNYESEASK